MCDCYMAECEGCGTQINMHIGDFSCSRESVTVWCPRCVKKEKPPEPFATRLYAKVIWERRRSCWTEAYAWKSNRIGSTVLIYCTDPDGHGIHPN